MNSMNNYVSVKVEFIGLDWFGYFGFF